MELCKLQPLLYFVGENMTIAYQVPSERCIKYKLLHLMFDFCFGPWVPCMNVANSKNNNYC